MKTLFFSIALFLGAIYGLAVAYNHSNYVFIEPTFTQSAYQPNCFYDYYSNHSLVKDLTCPISHSEENTKTRYSDNYNTRLVLEAFGFSHVSDIDVNNGCQNVCLSSFHKIIVLHSEYMTQTEFNFLTNNTKVVWVYPNAGYGLIDYHDNTISLIRGHGLGNVSNGFNWKLDNTKYEFTDCKHHNNWNYTTNQNQCYPNDAINIIKTLAGINVK